MIFWHSWPPAFSPFSTVNTLSHEKIRLTEAPFSLLSVLSAGLMDGNYAASTTLYRFPFSVCIRSAPMALIILPKRTTVMPRIAAG